MDSQENVENKIAYLIERMCDKEENEAYAYADKLAVIGTGEVLNELVKVLKCEDIENAYLAARALSKMEDNKDALDPLLEVIHHSSNKNRNGAFFQALEGFDLGLKFVDVCRIYLFGNFKSSALAKQYLDYEEFEVSPRTIKKAEKHLNHFEQNISKEDEDLTIKKQELEKILTELRKLFETA